MFIGPNKPRSSLWLSVSPWLSVRLWLSVSPSITHTVCHSFMLETDLTISYPLHMELSHYKGRKVTKFFFPKKSLQFDAQMGGAFTSEIKHLK